MLFRAVAVFGTLGLLLAGCEHSRTPSSAAPAAADSARDGTAGTARHESDASAFWYDRSRLLDVNGDGAKDSVRLYAVGANPDSMDIHLVLRSKGETLHEETWGGSYELIDPPEEIRTGADRALYLRKQLDEVLERVRTVPFEPEVFEAKWDSHCMESPHGCISLDLQKTVVKPDWKNTPAGEHAAVQERVRAVPVDSAEVRAIVAGIVERKLPNLELTYGYETHMLLAWDPARKRFWTLQTCC